MPETVIPDHTERRQHHRNNVYPSSRILHVHVHFECSREMLAVVLPAGLCPLLGHCRNHLVTFK